VPAVHADLRLEWGGRVGLAARLIHEPGTGRARLELADGTVAAFDGETAWVAPADADLPQARFHLLTWPYFLAAPWKLGDPGSRLEPLAPRELRGERCDVARLTFDSGVGDTPDDWYVVYTDPETHELRALAYIVTYGRAIEQAEAEPHVALYEAWTEVDGYRVPARIAIRDWSLADGPAATDLGVATFEAVRIAPAPAGAFQRPADARVDALPE
jgi:hypothetical protein